MVTATPATTPANGKARKAARKAANAAALAASTPPAIATPTVAVTHTNGGDQPTPTDLGDLDILGGLGGLATPPAPVKLAPRVAKIPGVAPNARTRAYFAGVVLARHGHANGITPGMVGEVDAAYGDENAIESGICLRNAWHAVRGFCATASVAIPAAAPATTPAS